MSQGANMVTVLESAARTATTVSGEFRNTIGKAGLYVIVDVTSVTATPTATPQLQIYDEASDDWYTIWESDSGLSGTGSHVYIFETGARGSETGTASNTGDVDEIVGIPLPARWRWRMAHGDADSITYSVGAHIIP